MWVERWRRIHNCFQRTIINNANIVLRVKEVPIPIRGEKKKISNERISILIRAINMHVRTSVGGSTALRVRGGTVKTKKQIIEFRQIFRGRKRSVADGAVED